MNSRQLEYVITLAEERSFSEAANKLLISQPSLSQYIQKLEKELGTELFERTQPLRLTFAGETYVNTAKHILELEKNMNEKLSDIMGKMRGRLVIGTGFLNSIILIPSILSIFNKKYPDVEFVIYEDIEANLKMKVDVGDIDMVLSTSEVLDEDYKNVHLMKEDYLLAVPVGMDIGNSGRNQGKIRTIPIEKVKDIPFIMLGNNTVIKEALEKICKMGGFKPKVAAVCTSAMASYSMVKAGVGGAIIPLSTYKIDYSPNVCYYKIQNNTIKRELTLYYRKNKYVTKIMEAFIEQCKTYFEENYGEENDYN